MKKTERLVFFYDLYIVARSRTFDAPKTIGVREAFDLMELVPIASRQKESAKGSELLYVADWDRVGDVVSILINKSDKAISDPVFTVPQEGKRRTAEKEDQEGQDFSIHVVVKLPGDDLSPALVLIEYCVGLGVPFVQRLLNDILRSAKNLSPASYEQNHPDGVLDDNGKPKKINVNFKCEFKGHLSDDLKNDLDNGKIQSIELITERTKNTSFDDDGYITEKSKSIMLTMKSEENPIRDKFDRIVGLLGRNKKDYSNARIKFKTAEGIDRTVDMQTADCFAEGYVKKAKLEQFNGDLCSSYEKFDDQIIAKMKVLIPPEA